MITAAVGQDRPVPSRKLMQAPQPRHTLRAGAEHQVIGVAKDDVRAGCAHFGRAHRLNGCGGANGHERRRADFAAQHLDAARAGLAIGGGNRKLESRGHLVGFRGVMRLRKPTLRLFNGNG